MASSARKSSAVKQSRLEIRLPAESKAQLMTAAQLSGVNLAEFTRRSVTERAQEVIAAHERTRLQPVDHAAFFAALDAPKSIPALSEALSRHADEVDSA